MTPTEAARIHKRIDDLTDRIAALHGDVREIKGACGPCRLDVDRLTGTVFGTNGEGLASRVWRINWLGSGVPATVAALLASMIVAGVCYALGINPPPPATP